MPAPWTAGAQVRIIGELHGQTTVNVLHMGTNSVVTDGGNLDTVLLNLAQALFDCVIEVLLPAVTSDWRFVKVDARRVYPTFSDPIEVTATPSNIGELSPCSHSISCSLLKIKTGVGGKSGRGRVFLPPPGESEVVASTIDGPTLVLIAAFATCVGSKFMGASPPSDWTLGVLSKKQAGAANANFDTAFRVAQSLSPVADLSYLGSRRKGRGL